MTLQQICANEALLSAKLLDTSKKHSQLTRQYLKGKHTADLWSQITRTSQKFTVLSRIYAKRFP